LIVYKNKEGFDKRNTKEVKEEPLEEDFLVYGLGISKKEALIVVVLKMDQSPVTIVRSKSSEEFISTNNTPDYL